MKAIWLLAKNTYIELIRDRILYGLLVFAVLLIGFSLVLGQLSFAEQARIATDFGFAAIHLSMVILSIFVGSTLVAREMDKKTIYTLLTRPISRTQFLLGKSLGLTCITGTVVLGLGIILLVVFWGLQVDIKGEYLIALAGIILESFVLLGLTIFFGTFASPIMAVTFSLSLFLIGHWLNDLSFFAAQSKLTSFIEFSEWVRFLLPNLERFNWRAAVTYQDTMKLMELALACGYSLSWFIFLISLASFILRRKNFA